MRPRYIDDLGWAMAEVYEGVTNQILLNLARHFKYVQDGHEPRGSFEYQARMLAQMGQINNETRDIILQSLGGADRALQEALQMAIYDALKGEEPALRRAAQRGFTARRPVTPELTPNQMQAFRSYYKQSADKMNLVNTVMLESTKSAYIQAVGSIANRVDVIHKVRETQKILNLAAGEVITGAETWNKATHDAVLRMADNGLTGFVDHAGRHWSPEAYVAMDIRTTLHNTANAAIWERADEYGVDTYQVSSHNGARPLCAPWQYKVISRTNSVREIPDLDGNMITVYGQIETSYGQPAGLFGINCGHYPMTFIPGFSTLKGRPQGDAENERTYAESQQQRALERELRQEKLKLDMLKASGATPEEIAEQRAKVRQASDDIQEFCDETGRARRRNRESTPIQASFPPDGSYDTSQFQTGYRDMINNFYTNGQNTTLQGPMATPTFTTQNDTQNDAQNNAQNVAQNATQQQNNSGTIEGATNNKELIQAIKNTYGVAVTNGLKDLDFGTTKQAMLGVQYMTNRYPELGQALTAVKLTRSGVMSCAGETLSFNRQYFESAAVLSDSIERCTGNGWWPKNTSVSSIGVHEMAHALEWFFDTHNGSYKDRSAIIDAWNDCTEARIVVNAACDAVRKTERWRGQSNATLIHTISGYASKTASEAMAEAFADVYANGQNASPVSLEIVRLSDERYRTLGGTGNGA